MVPESHTKIIYHCSSAQLVVNQENPDEFILIELMSDNQNDDGNTTHSLPPSWMGHGCDDPFYHSLLEFPCLSQWLV